MLGQTRNCSWIFVGSGKSCVTCVSSEFNICFRDIVRKTLYKKWVMSLPWNRPALMLKYLERLLFWRTMPQLLRKIYIYLIIHTFIHFFPWKLSRRRGTNFQWIGYGEEWFYGKCSRFIISSIVMPYYTKIKYI